MSEQQVRSNINQDENKTTLPIDLIMKIFGYFGHISHLQEYLGLSKEIRENIFKTPEIMKKVKINFETLSDWETKADFLRTKGSFIRNLKVNFEYRKDYSNCQAYNEGIKYIKSLESLSLFVYPSVIPKAVTNIFIQLENLKELKLNSVSICRLQHDISSDVKFKLRALEINDCFEFTENFQNFLHKQAESIETLKILGNQSDEVLKFSFEFFKKLKNLSIDPSKSIIYRGSVNEYKSDSIKHFEDLSRNSPNLKILYEKFPNLQSIKCTEFHNLAGTFEKLETLDVYCLCYGSLKDIKLPNLKTLKIKFHRIRNIYLQEPINDEFWNDFIKNVPNVEHFVLEEVYQEIDLVCILISLRILKKLRIFECHLLVMESVNIPNMLDITNHKLLIDKSRMTIELDAFLWNKCTFLIINLIKDYLAFKKYQNYPSCYGLQTFGNFEIIVPKKIVDTSEQLLEDWQYW